MLGRTHMALGSLGQGKSLCDRLYVNRPPCRLCGTIRRMKMALC